MLVKDPKVSKKIERLIGKMLTKCTEEVVFDFLEPCRQVTITITLKRGLINLQKTSNHQIGNLSSGSVTDLTPTDEDWVELLKLKPFSENPDRDKDRYLRQTLLIIREHGYVGYHQACQFHKPINEILKNNNNGYRFVKMYIEDAHREGYVLRKIE